MSPLGSVTTAARTELGVEHLRAVWQRALANTRGDVPHDPGAAHLDRLTTDALGLGLEQVTQHLLQTQPDFDAFERWIVETTGGVEPEQVLRLNAALQGRPAPAATQARLAAIEAMAPVLTAQDLAHWQTHGYVIVHNAVPCGACEAAEQVIWSHLDAQPQCPDSWYTPHAHSIMVQLFQHPALMANRQAERIHKAFAQLWGTPDLWASTDRVGFNVPQRPGWAFQGPGLHWDVSLTQPIPFATQGILYLTDTAVNQGAFTCVPGFHHRIDTWLDGLQPGADPREQDLHALGAVPIAGQAGDLIIWDNRLPHGSSPNSAARPRIVQYINMYPAQVTHSRGWR